MLNVCVAGITGWTGSALARAVDSAPDLNLCAGVSRATAGRTLEQVLSTAARGRIFASVAEAVRAQPVDVVVDYTSATAVRTNVWSAVQSGAHVVVGSSGLTAADYEELDQLARAQRVGVVASGNFSVMAAVMSRAATTAAQVLQHWEVLDYSSDGKPDAPSGTARELAEKLALVHPPQPPAAGETVVGMVEARGAAVGGTRVHSIRLPSFVVSTEVIFGGPDERLTMRHDPGSTPDPYIGGTLLAIRRVSQLVGVTRGLDELLFGEAAAG